MEAYNGTLITQIIRPELSTYFMKNINARYNVTIYLFIYLLFAFTMRQILEKTPFDGATMYT